ncbi:hypothetical protein BDR05DRAFT_989852 [Suillus weaverae]|nr:hypothetical protein BDR05DRAFT_989852 [Suillus weaverae]
MRLTFRVVLAVVAALTVFMTVSADVTDGCILPGYFCNTDADCCPGYGCDLGLVDVYDLLTHRRGSLTTDGDMSGLCDVGDFTVERWSLQTIKPCKSGTWRKEYWWEGHSRGTLTMCIQSLYRQSIGEFAASLVQEEFEERWIVKVACAMRTTWEFCRNADLDE